MSDSSSARRDVVFGAASRADDFVEEDTLHTPPQPTRPRRSQAGSGPQPIPPMPSSPAEAAVPEAAPETEDPAPIEPAPTSPVAPAVVESAAPEQPQAQPFGGSGGGAAFTPRPATSEKATTGFRGLLAKVGVPVGPSEAEKAENERAARRSANETIVRQATWTRAVSVLIANPKGGTGKTPASLLLGGTFASIRGGSVAVVETSDDPGALTYRAEGNPALGLGELVANVDSVTTAGQLAGYTAPQTSFASVIGSTGRRARLDGDAVVKVAAKVDEFYGVRVMDSGNVPTSSAFRGAVSVSDALVIPVMNAGDSTLEAIALLDELRADGGHAAALADNAIALRMLDGRPENAQVSQEVERVLLEAGVQTLLTIPFDPHIAERGQLTLASLNQSTRDAFAQAAATVVRSIQSAVNAGHHQKD